MTSMHAETYSSFRIIPSADGIMRTPSITHMPQDREKYTVRLKKEHLQNSLNRTPPVTMSLMNTIQDHSRPLQTRYTRDNLAGMKHKPPILPHGLPGP